MAIVKLVMVGNGGVGKSAITMCFISNTWVAEYDPTIEDSHRKQLIVDDEVVVVDILDTAGQEEFSSMQDQWFRAGEGFLCVYSITVKRTFDELPKLTQKILRIQDVAKIPMVIVGNKCDLEEERQVPTDEGARFAKTLNCPFFEASAKNNLNVDEAYKELVRQVKAYQNNKTGGKEGGPSSPGKTNKPASKPSSGKRSCLLF
eukprot:TRINITY_DN25768_c0_g1_i1.p1 TRINITY_DN25768_c0_g1~~TRINITY_DN25768_c0_g1_i1.p1  ORF type:complete len:203 (+),score=60.53 TRINITY_DN25768_c0_g1_i1:125-733(+)